MTKTVVVLGASYGGLGVAHKLLKSSRSSIPDLKVVLVSPNTHLYWSIASVRAVVPDTIPDADLAKPLAAGFAAYPPEAFELIIGSASALDSTSKIVTIALAPSQDDAAQTPRIQDIAYDMLVIATGARSLDASMPWKSTGSHQDTMVRLQNVRARISRASRIVVAGAGATGVELAAEIAYAFGSRKHVTLLSAGPQILGCDQIAGNAKKELVALGVEVRDNAKVVETREREKQKDGETETETETEVVIEEHGEGGGEQTLVCDLYLPTMGQRPNTDWIGKALLTDRGYLDVDECFQVKGTEGVFGVGDAVSLPRASFVVTDWHSPQVAKNVELALKDEQPRPVSNMQAEIFFTATGPKRGAGRIGWVNVPSFVVYMGKGRTLGVERVQKYVDGSR